MTSHRDREVNRVVRIAQNAWVAQAKRITHEAKLLEAILMNAEKDPGFRAAYEAAMRVADEDFRKTDICLKAMNASRLIQAIQEAKREAVEAAQKASPEASPEV